MKLLRRAQPQRTSDFVYFSSGRSDYDLLRGIRVFTDMSDDPYVRVSALPYFPNWINNRGPDNHLKLLFISQPTHPELDEAIANFCQGCPIIVDFISRLTEDRTEFSGMESILRADWVTVGPSVPDDQFDMLQDLKQGRASLLPDWYADNEDPFVAGLTTAAVGAQTRVTEKARLAQR